MEKHIYYQTVKSEFSFLKNPKTLSDLLSSHIPIQNGGALVPLSSLHLSNNEVIEKLWKWREEHSYAYPTRYATSVESTLKWIKNAIIDNENRILFLIYDEGSKLIGHAGFADVLNDKCFLEFDNILRGDLQARKGIISDVMQTLKKWADSVLFPQGYYLRVLKSNTHAIKFYKNLNFKEIDSYPLYKEESSSGYKLSDVKKNDGESPVDEFIIMEPTSNFDPSKEMILTAGPSIGTREKVFAWDAAVYGWNHQWSKYLTDFEREFADYVGVKYAIATSSCTGALHIALDALGIKEGDEVIVPEVTWVATANAVRYVGATPIFADIDISTWNICPQSIKQLITDKTKAIIPVHLYGNPCNMDDILNIANEYGLFVVEDAAPSIGAEYKNKRTGSFGHFSAFSFQGAKLAVTGEGGMLCTNDEELYRKAYRIWDQGRIPGSFWIEELGVKYKMSNIQAAIGLGQLRRNNAMVEAKRRINTWYKERLGGLEQIDFWQELPDSRCIYWMTNIRLKEEAKIDRELFCKKLKEFNIDTRPVFPAISQYPYWPQRQLPQKNANIISKTAINLPSGVTLTRDKVNYVCDKIIEILL